MEEQNGIVKAISLVGLKQPGERKPVWCSIESPFGAV